MTDHQAYQHISKQVKKAQLRLNSFQLLRYWLMTLFYIFLTESVVLAILKLTPWTLPVLPLVWTSLALSIPIAFVLHWRKIHTLDNTAIMVDQHLNLKEKISSALELSSDSNHLTGDSSEWRHAQLFDAYQECKRLDLRKAFPLMMPTEARWLWAPAFAFLLIAFIIPQWQLFTGNVQSLAMANELNKKVVDKEAQELLKRQVQIESRTQDKAMDIVPKLAKEIKELANDLSKGKVEKREALAKVSSLEKNWQERRENLKQMEEKNSDLMPLSQMKMTGEIAQNIKSGNFRKASEALQNLQKKLKMGDLSEESKLRLAKELTQMANAMDKELPLSQSFELAAIDIQAGDLDNAIDSLEQSELTLKDLEDMMKQMALLEEGLKNLEECKLGLLGKCKSCGGGQCNGANGGLCQGQGEGTKPWAAGDTGNQGNGMGGPGIGRGGQAQFEENEVVLKKSNIDAKFQKAPIAGLLKVKGHPLASEASLLPQDILMETRQVQEDALVKEQVPITYRNQVRSYFDSLQTGSSEDAAASQ